MTTTNNEKNIPKQFEYIDALFQLKGRPARPRFVTVLDVFEHHYTGAKFYRVRIEYVSYVGEGYPAVDYKTITESEMMDMLAKRKEN